MWTVSVNRAVKFQIKNSIWLLRKLQKTLGGYSFAAPCT